MSATVKISVLVDDTGEKPRTIQHWSDLGILRAQSSTDKQGRGNHREYPVDRLFGERKWALLASAYAKLRLPLGDIRKLIYADRLFYDPIDQIDKNDPNYEAALKVRAQRDEDHLRWPLFVEPFEAAVLGEKNILAAVALRPDDQQSPVQVCYFRHVKPTIGSASPGADDIIEDHNITVFQRLPEATQKDLMRVLSARRSQERMLRDFMARNPLAIMLNLSQIFEPLHRPLPEQSS